MKKEYMKPILIVESFQLDAAVAASCSSQGYTAINHGVGTCWENTGDRYLFDANSCDVDLTPGDGDGSDTTCYHGPTLTGGVTYIYS